MMGPSHLAVAAAGYLALWWHPVPTPLGALTAPLVGGPLLVGGPPLVAVGVSLLLATSSALGPDLDKRGSTIARLGGWPTAVTAWGIEHTLRHRGPLHSLLAAGAIWFLAELLGAALGVSGLGNVLAFGWLAHLLADLGTRRGIPLLWPVPVSVRPPLRFATGTWQETLVVAAILSICALWAAAGA
jgi:inner membrane protein